jgi:multisubunit Na+/H+ antiporter MnhB subunit
VKAPWKTAGKIILAVLVAGLGGLVFIVSDPVFFRTDAQIERYIEIARYLNIRNVVSAIYLGPRLIDTIVEVLIVVATVFGMLFIRRDH